MLQYIRAERHHLKKERTGTNEAKPTLKTKTKAIRRPHIGAPYGDIYYIYSRNTHVGSTAAQQRNIHKRNNLLGWLAKTVAKLCQNVIVLLVVGYIGNAAVHVQSVG